MIEMFFFLDFSDEGGLKVVSSLSWEKIFVNSVHVCFNKSSYMVQHFN